MELLEPSGNVYDENDVKFGVFQNFSKFLVRLSSSKTVRREVHGKCVRPGQRIVLVPPLTDNLATKSTFDLEWNEGRCCTWVT